MPYNVRPRPPSIPPPHLVRVGCGSGSCGPSQPIWAHPSWRRVTHKSPTQGCVWVLPQIVPNLCWERLLEFGDILKTFMGHKGGFQHFLKLSQIIPKLCSIFPSHLPHVENLCWGPLSYRVCGKCRSFVLGLRNVEPMINKAHVPGSPQNFQYLPSTCLNCFWQHAKFVLVWWLTT